MSHILYQTPAPMVLLAKGDHPAIEQPGRRGSVDSIKEI